MSPQIGFDHFVDDAEEPEPEPENLEEYGPTMDEPLPEPELEALYESGGELLDRREIPDSGLSLSDVTDWPSHKREEDREDVTEEEAEILRGLDRESPPDAGGKEQALATDGGQALEEADERGNYEPGDTVLVIEDVAVGLMTSPNILEAEVSSSGKSVMIPEDADSIHGSRRLDAETIFAGESEYRDSTGYDLYTPGRFRSNQRANHAPGPQAGASSVTDPDELPDPTHWPEGVEPDETPDECPECGASGPWYDVGKPRCEHCGETVDPDAEPESEEKDEMPDKWDLSTLEAGDTLIIEGHSGVFVITRMRWMRGTNNNQVNRIEAAKREGGEWRSYELQKLSSMEGPRLKVDQEGSGTDVLVNVNDSDHARDFEKTGHDEDKRRRYIRDTRDA